jgi:serine/threonine protein kinase
MPLRGEAAPDRATYVSLERIAGGSELLHRCRHAVLGTDCVQKTVPIASGSVAFFEPRLLEELDHPHITPVREAQFDPDYGNRVTFVMPWYHGGSVARALVADHHFSLSEAVNVAREVLDAVEYLHTRRGYAHRDVKGDNVLLDTERQHGYLSDFGLAAELEADGFAPAVLATYEYMAPECAVTQRHGPTSDIYGVGMVLFEMLNGRIPWEDVDRARVERRVLSGRRALPNADYAPGAFAAPIPGRLIRITRKAIHADPRQRYATAAEFIRALNEVVTIDWRRVAGANLETRWEGTWPPHARPEARDSYRVTTRLLERGAAKGKLRLVADYRRPGALSWRRFGVRDRDIDSEDTDALRTFFSEVAANADHRRAAR